MDPSVSPCPVAVDLVVFAVTDGDLKVLLVRRQAPPFRGTWALPGDAVDLGDMGRRSGEDLRAAARRVFRTHTGLARDPGWLQQLLTFGRSGRDPRGRVITVAWWTLVRPELLSLIGTRNQMEWFSIGEEVPWMRLALDHAEILAAGADALRVRVEQPDVLFELVPQSFTVAEIQAAESAVLDRTTDTRNFRRRFQRWIDAGLVEQAPGKRHLGRSRPAKVWRPTRRIPGHPENRSAG